jgi:hypothetical protein
VVVQRIAAWIATQLCPPAHSQSGDLVSISALPADAHNLLDDLPDLIWRAFLLPGQISHASCQLAQSRAMWSSSALPLELTPTSVQVCCQSDHLASILSAPHQLSI